MLLKYHPYDALVLPTKFSHNLTWNTVILFHIGQQGLKTFSTDSYAGTQKTLNIFRVLSVKDTSHANLNKDSQPDINTHTI